MPAKARQAWTHDQARNMLENGAPRPPFPHIGAGPRLVPSTAPAPRTHHGCGPGAVEVHETAVVHRWICYHPGRPLDCPDKPQGASA